MQKLCQEQKIFVANLSRISKRLERVLWVRQIIRHKLVRNESIDLESIYVRLAEGSSFAENPQSPPNLCTDTYVVQNSSSSVNISEALDEDDNGVLKILNEFFSTSDEASISPNEPRILL